MSNFITFMQRRTGSKHPDRVFRLYTIMMSLVLLYPLRYLNIRAFYRSANSLRYEMYAVRDGVYYKHYRYGMRSVRANAFKNMLWV